MAANWTGFESALETAAYTVWTATNPAAGGGGIWEADSVEREDFDQVTAPAGHAQSPYCVIEMGEATPAEGAPITAKIYQVLVTFHYVTRIDLNGQGAALVRPQLEAMEDYLLGTGLTDNYAVLAVEGFSLPPGHPANEAFIAADLPWCAGSVTARCWVGES